MTRAPRRDRVATLLFLAGSETAGIGRASCASDGWIPRRAKHSRMRSWQRPAWSASSTRRRTRSAVPKPDRARRTLCTVIDGSRPTSRPSRIKVSSASLSHARAPSARSFCMPVRRSQSAAAQIVPLACAGRRSQASAVDFVVVVAAVPGPDVRRLEHGRRPVVAEPLVELRLRVVLSPGRAQRVGAEVGRVACEMVTVLVVERPCIVRGDVSVPAAARLDEGAVLEELPART